MNFIINTITAWDEPPRARHQVANALIANGHNVVFVTRNKIGKPKISFIAENDSLLRVEPYFWVDYRYRYRIPGLNEVYQDWLYKILLGKFPDHIVINFDFTAHRLFRYFKSVMYYCNDEYIGNSKYPFWVINKYHEGCENKMIRNSRFCITTADYLTQKLKRKNPDTHQILLGAPVISDYHANSNGKEKSSHQIIVGLVGFIRRNYISPTIISDLLKDKRFKVILVGPVHENFLAFLPRTENLVLKGILKGPELYEAINGFDVAIAPYMVENINPGGTPNKLWQYLALGKPSVVSNLPNLKSFNIPEKFAYIAEEEKDFVDLIAKAYEENTPELMQKRREFAADNSWDNRIKEFLKYVKQYFGQ